MASRHQRYQRHQRAIACATDDASFQDASDAFRSLQQIKGKLMTAVSKSSDRMTQMHLRSAQVAINTALIELNSASKIMLKPKQGT